LPPAICRRLIRAATGNSSRLGRRTSENVAAASAWQARRIILPFSDPQRDDSADPRDDLAPVLVRALQALGYLGDCDEE
jgi:hypothetical protein